MIDQAALIASLVALAGVLAKTLQEAIVRRRGGNGAATKLKLEALEREVTTWARRVEKLEYDLNHPDGWLRRKHHDDAGKETARRLREGGD